jgi:hypothetical protein
MRIHPRALPALVATLAAAQMLGAQAPTGVKICLAPATVESSSNGNAAADAAREAFTSFLTGPSLSSQPLQARLTSQAREEAKQAGCPFILLTTIKHTSKRSGGGLLGQVAAGAARQGVAEAGIGGSVAGRIAGSAANTGINQAAYAYAGSIRNKDEFTLGWRLEAADGSVLGEEKNKRTAKSDGEDLLTPLVQSAAEQVVAAARRKAP